MIYEHNLTKSASGSVYSFQTYNVTIIYDEHYNEKNINNYDTDELITAYTAI